MTMIIWSHKRFGKHYDKLTPKLKKKIDGVIERFRQNPFDPLLENHPLIGNMQGQRAISVTGNYRITFEEYNDYASVLLLDVGTHNQVYHS